MQSLSRQIRRGHAYIYFDNVTKDVKVMHKRGTNRKTYEAFLKDRFFSYEQQYCDNVTKPIVKWNKAPGA